MFVLGILLHRTNYECMHSKLQQRVNVTYYKPSKRIAQTTYEWKKFRISLDYSQLTSESCHSVDTIPEDTEEGKDSSENTITCSAEDIVTENHVKVVKGTLDKVVNFLENLLYVIPLDDGYKSEKTGFVYKNSDFILRVKIIACGKHCNMIASSIYQDVEKEFNRPIAGECLINCRNIPSEVSDFYSSNNLFYITLLHEFIHALGFSPSYFDYMHPHEDPTPHTNPVCSIAKYYKYYEILTTPMAHKFALNHYGVEYYNGDYGHKCLSGLELEDSGDEMTAYSHFETRTLMSDLMTDLSMASNGVNFMRITDATLAFLLDTGNYKVNWSMAQPLVWGNPESIDGQFIKDFATGPPQTTFPEGYLGNQADDDHILFNYKGSGKINKSFISKIADLKCKTEEMGDEESYICDILYFVDPYNLSILARDSVFDYNFRKFPITDCKDGEAMLKGNYAKCVKYHCKGFESFTADIPGYGKITCDNSTIGKPIQFKDAESHLYDISCPNPERFCRTVKLHEMHFIKDPFVLNVSQLEPTIDKDATANTSNQDTGDTNTNQNPDKNKNIYIIVGVVCGVLLIAIIVGVALYIACKKSDDGDQDIEDIQDNAAPKDNAEPREGEASQDVEMSKDNEESQHNEKSENNAEPQESEAAHDNEEPKHNKDPTDNEELQEP